MNAYRTGMGMVVWLAVAGCNDGNVTKGSTVPPIAGIIGGPDQPGGAGQVPAEVRADVHSVVPLTTIRLENLSREVEDAVETVPDGGAEFLTLLVTGDVGDELRVSLTHPEEGAIARDFEVTRPQISEVRDPAGPLPVIHAGVAAQVSGSGYCVAAGCNKILLDSSPLAIMEEPRPGLLYFQVPPGTAPGTHAIRVAVAQTEGAEPSYVSVPFTVTLEP